MIFYRLSPLTLSIGLALLLGAALLTGEFGEPLHHARGVAALFQHHQDQPEGSQRPCGSAARCDLSCRSAQRLAGSGVCSRPR